jgi:hypothetical protein
MIKRLHYFADISGVIVISLPGGSHQFVENQFFHFIFFVRHEISKKIRMA